MKLMVKKKTTFRDNAKWTSGDKTMIRKSLFLMLVLTCVGFAQSITDLKDQIAGSSQTTALKIPMPAENPEGPSIIQSDLPHKETVTIAPGVKDSVSINYYGYDYFSNKNKLLFLDNLPAPDNYLVGPGDEILVTIWGETELREKSSINRDGNIYFENVGLVNLINLNFSQAKRVLKSRFENVFSTLRGGATASTFIEISMGSLKSINIHFLGEVNSPGIMPIHPFSTVTTGLLQEGGVSLIGSLRDIRIIRNGKVLKSIDYYQYLQEGAIENDVRLIDNDVISVPVRKSTIQIRGRVRRPGIFELKAGETLRDLIKFAGGLENDAGAKVEIRRVLPLEYRKNNLDDIQHIWVDHSEVNTVELMDGDRVNVAPLFVTDRTVHIEGRVKNPGQFSLASGMKVKDLLDLAGGIFSKDQWSKIYPFRADLIRTDRAESTSAIIPIRLDSLKSGSLSQNILLQDGDRLIIYPTEINKYTKTVEIFGDIRAPGDYVLDENMGLRDLILRAGGFSFSAYPAEVAVNSIDPFNINAAHLSSELKVKVNPALFDDFPELDEYKLKNKDQVFVRKSPEFQFQRNISIEGEVKFPGVYALEKKDENLEAVIKRAGNFTEEAFRQGLLVFRDDKRLILERKGRNNVDLNLPLTPGDKIIIPKHTQTIEVRGEVNSPGFVQYKKGLSIRDYIRIAGNFTQEGDKETVSVYYPNGESNSRSYYFFDPPVREGSIIVVYKKPEELPLDKTALLTEITTIVIQSLSLLLVVDKLAN
jgi:protein involved in polysaccharide export with SLBB domain